MRRSLSALLSILSFFLLSACHGLGTTEQPPLFHYDTTAVQSLIEQQIQESEVLMYADKYTREHLESDTSFHWISDQGVSDQADVLLKYLQDVEDEGFKKETFHVGSINADIKDLRSRIMEGVVRDSVDTLMARLEFELTHSLFRYAYGQRYGYVKPHHLFNNLLEGDSIGGQPTYRQLFDINCDIPSDSLACEALRCVENGTLDNFLKEVQPTDSLYYQIRRDYAQARQQRNTSRMELAKINLERSRWRYPRPHGGKYIWVNLAGYELTAVDTEKDTTFTMRICGGGQSHKSPLLTSKIQYLELNPYWTIPQSIIRKEIVTDHLGDSAYFSRNNIHAIEKESQEEVNPASLSEAQLRSARYTLRQEKGEGNSLGRMIFRFPNKFSVYLHDTNNKGAFERDNRAVSHGCIRLQRPLDLALFLIGDPDEFTIDRIRMAIDLEPISAKGKKYAENHPDAKPMSGYKFSSATPLWIDYYTLFPSPSGQLEEHPDSYHYDPEIAKILDRL